MKKAQVFGIIFLLAFSILITTSFVIAEGAGGPGGPAGTSGAGNTFATSINKGITTVTSVLEPIFIQILGSDGTTDNAYLFARILFLFLIFSVIYVVLSRVPFFIDRTGIVVLIGALISILSMRSVVSPAMIEAIALPTETLGIAISVGIPLVVAAFLIESQQGLGAAGVPRAARNSAWILIIVILLGLWITRYDALTQKGLNPFALYVYPLAAFLAFLMMIFDGTIQKWRVGWQIDKAREESKSDEMRAYKRELIELDGDLRTNVITNAEYHRRVSKIRAKIKALS
ncbi:hypothetical protein FJZ18_01495 [Candidatus Pacearchaeota archaeon]|nr:hypothetical protein [Candidatus Pacearchaeota archaeon]